MAAFRILELAGTGGVRAIEEGAVGPPEAGNRRWIDLADPDPGSLEILRARFGFHPLAIEDCAQLDQRPKLEEYGDHLFLVTQGFTCADPHIRELELHELHAFLGEGYLVTVHAGTLPALESVWRRATTDSALFEHGMDFVYYLVADALVDMNFPLLDRIADELESIEDAVLERPRPAELPRIFELKRHLVEMRKVLSPQRDTIAMLVRLGEARVSERTALYLRDVHDHLVRLNESIEANRDLLGNALDAYLSTASNHTNEIMKSLTLLSAVFLPLSFLVGFFGQNFRSLLGVE